MATRDALELVDRDPRIYEIAASATRDNVHCRAVKGTNNICFFPCSRYNYWEECMLGPGVGLPQDPAAYRQHGVKVLQFVVRPGRSPTLHPPRLPSFFWLCLSPVLSSSFVSFLKGSHDGKDEFVLRAALLLNAVV